MIMGHINDQSPLQRALQTLLRGAASGIRQFPQFQQKQEESKLLRKTREATTARSQERLGLERARFGQGIRKEESALDKAIRDREFEGVQQRAVGRLAESLGLSSQQAGDFAISGGRPQNISGLLPRTTKETKPPQFKQAPDLAGKARAGFGKGLEKFSKDQLKQEDMRQVEFPNLFSLARDAKRKVREIFRANPRAFAGQTLKQAEDSVENEAVSLMSQLLQQQGFEADLGTQQTRDILTRPETVRGLPPGSGRTNLQNLSDEELERIARGE